MSRSHHNFISIISMALPENFMSSRKKGKIKNRHLYIRDKQQVGRIIMKFQNKGVFYVQKCKFMRV